MARSKHFRSHGKDLLFPLKGGFQLVTVGRLDACTWNDNIRDLEQLIYASQDMYPGIEHWFKEKVIPGLRSSERIAYLAYENNKPIASAVLKRGAKSKICHLKIHRDFQDLHLGQMFFAQMTFEILNEAKQIHFTLPESLWNARSTFFESFGFSSATKASRQYRRGDDELLCSAGTNEVWLAALQKLPSLLNRFSVGGRDSRQNLVLSIKAQYGERIINGRKKIEVRKRFSRKWIGSRVVLYASHPASALIGEATIRSVTEGRPIDIWANFAPSLGCSLSEFEAYTWSAPKVSAIELDDIAPYKSPILRSEMSRLIGRELLAPQSYCELNFRKSSGWTSAISIISLLHHHVVNRPSADTR